MANSKVSNGGGCAGMFVALIAVALIVLKLTGQIAWPWFWVLTPLWFGPSIVVVALIIAGIIIWRNTDHDVESDGNGSL